MTLAAVLALSATACDKTELTQDAGSGNLQVPSSTTTTVAPPAAAQAAQNHLSDYSGLLLEPGDLSDQEDTFAVRSTVANPNGLHGASALFVNADDTRAISITVATYPGAAVATSTLRQALSTADTTVVGGKPQPVAVGTDGTMIKGTAPDGGKAVTMLLFTQGPALARLEFDSANGDATTDQFVENIGRMQSVALRVGIPDDTE